MHKLFKISLFIIFVQVFIFAKVVTKPGAISSGETISYFPKTGESFRVTQDLDYILPNATFDVQLKNGTNIYYDSKNQSDDIYFVFNEPVEYGDEIVVKVNNGRFKYIMHSVKELPKSVKSVLKESKKKKKKKDKKVKKHKSSLVQTQQYCFDEFDKPYPCEQPNDVEVKTEIIPALEVKREVENSHEVVKDNFFKTFSEKIANALKSIKASMSAEKNTKTIKTESKVIQKEQSKKNLPPLLPETKSFKPVKTVKTIPHLPISSFDTKKIENQEKAQLPTFKNSSIPQNDTLPTYQPQLPKKLEHISVYGDLSSPPKIPVYKPEIKTYTKPTLSNSDIKQPQINTPYLVNKPSLKEQKQSLPENIIKPEISKTSIQSPKIKTEVIQIPVSQKPQAQVVKQIPQTLQQVPDLVIPKQIQEPKTPPPVIIQEPKKELVVKPEKEHNKIVITKIINKKKKKEPQIQVSQERMSDRVLGGGYSDNLNEGIVSVKAYSNHKPISAWIEVYQRDNIHRVKTFYTGRTKDIKLPAGTYILKATYRSGSSKQKKILGRITLHEGESIHKKVYFNIGTLNIVCKKHDKPAYAKIEVYKRGSKRRYAYTFSSHSTGVAHLRLGVGGYRIVVIEHGKKKIFDNVKITSSAVKTITAEF